MKWCFPLLVLTIAIATQTWAKAHDGPSDREIDAACKKEFPDFFGDYFRRSNCETEAKEKRAAVKLKREEQERKEAREEGARTCISNDLARLESTLRRLRDQAKSKSTLDEMRQLIESVTKQKSNILPSDLNIKEKVLIAALPPNSDTDFYFLINVQLTEQGELRSFRVWAQDPPKGYQGGSEPIGEFTFSWESQRIADEAAMRQRQVRDLQAAALQKLSLINFEAKCSPLHNMQVCRLVKFNFGVTNNSQAPVYSVSFGWNFVLDASSECPQQLVPKKTERSPTYQRWLRKFEQWAKWTFCLTTAKEAETRREHEQTIAPEP